MSHSAEKFRRGILYCCNNSGYRKSLDKGGGEYHDFPSKFLSHCTETFRRGILYCCNNSRFSVEIFLSHSAEKFRRGILYCCNNSGYRKSLGGGSITIFRRSFCLTVPKHFIGEHFGVVSEKFFYRKFSCIGGGASRFCRNFLSHRTETKSFVKEPFCFPEILWYRKKFMDKRGHITIFSRDFYVSQCRKLS